MNIDKDDFGIFGHWFGGARVKAERRQQSV